VLTQNLQTIDNEWDELKKSISLDKQYAYFKEEQTVSPKQSTRYDQNKITSPEKIETPSVEKSAAEEKKHVQEAGKPVAIEPVQTSEYIAEQKSSVQEPHQKPFLFKSTDIGFKEEADSPLPSILDEVQKEQSKQVQTAAEEVTQIKPKIEEQVQKQEHKIESPEIKSEKADTIQSSYSLFDLLDSMLQLRQTVTHLKKRQPTRTQPQPKQLATK
jgi:hypothetical protein